MTPDFNGWMLAKAGVLIEPASRELKLKLARRERLFYENRIMSADAVRCLINDALRRFPDRPMWDYRAASPNYIEPKHRTQGGRKGRRGRTPKA